jgi:hypothetical protein
MGVESSWVHSSWSDGRAVGLGIERRFAGERGARLPARALVASGLLIALSGVFPGDFDNRTSATMIVHGVGSIGSFVAFLVSAFSLPRVLNRFDGWRRFRWPSLAVTWASILWVGPIGYGLWRDPVTARP